MTTAILHALRAAVDAKAAYWDRMNELEAALNCEDPPDDINNYLVEHVDDLAVNVREPGDVGWINEIYAENVAQEVARLAGEAGDAD